MRAFSAATGNAAMSPHAMLTMTAWAKPSASDPMGVPPTAQVPSSQEDQNGRARDQVSNGFATACRPAKKNKSQCAFNFPADEGPDRSTDRNRDYARHSEVHKHRRHASEGARAGEPRPWRRTRQY